VPSVIVASETEAASTQQVDDGPADDGTWSQRDGPQSGGPSLLSDTDAEVWELGSRKRA